MKGSDLNVIRSNRMRTAILGAGQMGCWLAKEFSKEHDVAVYDVDRGKLKGLEGMRALQEMHDISAFNPEILINAVSLQDTISAFEEVAPHISESCIIGDIASIKGGLMDYYERSPFRFVSVHPMFGATFADMRYLREESVIIIKESDKEGVQLFRTVFERLKVGIFECSFEEHDRMMAYSLTIPFICSMAFAACVDGRAVPGTTFSKHMGVAKGLLSEDGHLLTEILFSRYSLAELDRVTAKLEYLKHIIRERDQEELGVFFQRLRKNIHPAQQD